MKEQIIEYMIELLEVLDGCGIIFTDEELAREHLSEDFGEFKRLQRIISGEEGK